MQQMYFYELYIQTRLQDDNYYKYYDKKVFWSNKDYSQKQWKKIVNELKIKTKSNGWYDEIDFKDISKQMAEYEIYELIAPLYGYIDFPEEK